MATLTLFGQQHQLKDADTPEEQQDLLNLISRAEEMAGDIPDLKPKERSYIILLLKILQEQKNIEQSAQYSQNHIDRVQDLCDKIDESVEKSRDLLIDLEA